MRKNATSPLLVAGAGGLTELVRKGQSRKKGKKKGRKA